MIFGRSAIRFSLINPYQGAEFNTLVQLGNASRNPNEMGGTLHGAVFYGRDNSGQIYVYTKNGWQVRPVVMKLQDLIKSEPSYGAPIGFGGETGYYNHK